ncbi:aspartic proteinase CDR1 [Prunus yedoensis var. nudiflora]|uniref:Aspartic proteinase CDR1 n=1 Tax=Prunus yedoensis var. nudiflora TaxID=2094558 RepID=A0A314Y1Z7_PRUYE|nr:aspartic proteinase CDR1 [Prunus yedoensis var. nudiflora]
MAAYHSCAFVALSTTLLFLLCASSLSLASAKGGFSVDLIHRDSPKSPFYNPSLTPSQRLANALRRSINRLNHFSPVASSLSQDGLNQVEATLIMNRGEYLMEASIGTPPFPIKAIADTGSDLIWTQCKPCPSCYQQTDPLFDPERSSTYKALPCSSNQCVSLNGTCSSSNCQYSVSYGDGSHSRGNFARETLTLGSTTGRNVAFPKTLIGCGHDNNGTFDEKSSGIVGLGGGSQVVSTPIVQGLYPETFYFLTVEAISVGDTKLAFPPSTFANGEGNIIIDSGTTLTLFPSDFYANLEAEVDKAIGRERMDVPNVPLSLCYKSSESEAEFKAPTLTVHFKGADVKLDAAHTFVRASEEAVCFAFAPTKSISIYGNLSQMDFLVGYDKKKQTVSFKPTDCTK